MAKANANTGSRIGDRREGRQLRSLSGAVKLAPYIMRNRSDAWNIYEDNLEISHIEDWIIQKRGEGSGKLNFTHLIVAAYVRTVSMRPGINRFVVSQRIFARNAIQVSLRVRKNVGSDSDMTQIKIDFSPNDTIFDIYDRIESATENVQAGSGDSDYDRLANSLTRMSRFILRPLMGILRSLDKNDWLPQNILNASPYHASLFLCDLGSMGVQSVHHHLYDFGNTPLLLSYGAKRSSYELDKEGSVQKRNYVDLRYSVDERIADTAYLVESLKYMKYFLKNPSLLELPPETVVEDVN